MSESSCDDAQTRAARLVRLYPAEWRTRYGDEFSELLAADLVDRPRSWARTLDVAFGAVMARLAALGLAGTTVDPSDQPRRSLATLGCALAIFLTFALSIWTHLTIALRSAAPATTATHTAIIVMTIAVTICVGAATAGAIPIAWTAIRAAARRSTLRLRISDLMCMAGVAILIVGSLTFHNGWSHTSSHAWPQQSTGPGGPAAFMWVATLSVSSYWAHPTILLNLPASEVAWMVVNALALTLSVVGAAKTARQLDVSIRLLRFVTNASEVAIAGLVLFLLGTLAWLIDGGPGPGHLYQAGTVDQLGLAVMTASLIAAIRTVQRTHG